MKVDIIISADDIKDEKIEGKTVVVIDMLRATSVIVTALNNGCKGVIPVTTIDEAKEIANKNRDNYVLGGERNALKIKGFDFSNSPLEYKKEIAENKILIMTTSNGTRAIKGSEKAKNIFIGALINTKAVSQKIIELNDDVVFINSGTDGQFSMDDFICAGYMIYCISKNKKVELSDISKTALYIYENNKDIFSFIENAKHYKRMKDLALYDDLEYCCQKDIINIVPKYKDGIIK